MPSTPSAHSLASRYGAHKSWSNTVDRAARTRPARTKSPGSIEYHLERLDPERFANATEEQRLAAAESAKRAYFQAIALKSAEVRSRKASS